MYTRQQELCVNKEQIASAPDSKCKFFYLYATMSMFTGRNP